MRLRKWALMTGITLTLIFSSQFLAAQPDRPTGQVIKINLNLQRFIGKPSWLIIIRDVDHGQNIPYLFDITRNQDYWIALTYGHDYYVLASEMTLNPYEKKITNFCDLESMGAIHRGVSMDIMVSGKLTKNPDLISCRVLKYADPNFNIAPQE